MGSLLYRPTPAFTPAKERWVGLAPELAAQVARQPSPDEAREALLTFLFENERRLRSGAGAPLRALVFNLALQATQALKNIFSARNEQVARCSAAGTLWQALRDPGFACDSEAFWQDLYHLFLATFGQSPMYEGVQPPAFLSMEGARAGRARSRELDRMGAQIIRRVERYPHGLGRDAVARRSENRERILGVLGGEADDWGHWRWHLEHIVRDAQTLGRMVRLSADERCAIDLARAHGLPFGVTPYYVSLMDHASDRKRDHAVRAQVLPPVEYVECLRALRAACPESLDYMAERDTSPVPLVTRRYPQIAIFKPFNTCAQICVYCQRNWEIRDAMAPDALAARPAIERALAWFRRSTTLREVLLTGGDPLLLDEATVDWLLQEFTRMPHIRRLRFGTRTLAVLPMRVTPALLEVFARHHKRDHCTLCLVTHFEHPYEITPEARQAVQAIRRLGMNIYNQQVYTIENSRKFETVALRWALKEIGIDPYYTFNMKGKEETRAYRVPVARILQERKEEARLSPGTVRTDEPVFNLPRLGKNYLRAGQDHDLIGLRADGARVYEFLPWEKNIIPTPMYIFHDVPIYEYLQSLVRRGETIEDYQNIWYYF